jgi:hypothetical protein
MAYSINPEDVGIVYRWRDSSNGMYYIGSHRGTSDDGYICSSKYMMSAYKKRPDCFSREILYTGKDFVELEDLMLKTLDAGNDESSYNLVSFGSFNVTGLKRTKETRKKQSEVRMGMQFSEEHKANISKSMFGTARRAAPLLEISTGIIYEQTRHYAEKIGARPSAISEALRVYKKTGYKREIISDIEPAPKIRFRKNK